MPHKTSEAKRKYQREYYWKNGDRRLEYAKEYGKQYRKKNRQKILKRQRKYRKIHREEINLRERC